MHPAVLRLQSIQTEFSVARDPTTDAIVVLADALYARFRISA